jgi:hypothetical protein
MAIYEDIKPGQKWLRKNTSYSEVNIIAVSGSMIKIEADGRLEWTNKDEFKQQLEYGSKPIDTELNMGAEEKE